MGTGQGNKVAISGKICQPTFNGNCNSVNHIPPKVKGKISTFGSNNKPNSYIWDMSSNKVSRKVPYLKSDLLELQRKYSNITVSKDTYNSIDIKCLIERVKSLEHMLGDVKMKLEYQNSCSLF